tara:strand:+ start:166 stop:1362 length:1197 start_codon:yes stop_codon:yes gene_type:complete
MAIDPRISLALQLPTTQGASEVNNIFQNNLNQAQNRAIGEQQKQINEQTIQSNQQGQDVQKENRVIQLANEAGTQAAPLIQSGNIEQAQVVLTNLLGSLQAQGLPTQPTQQLLAGLKGGDTEGVLQAISGMNQVAQQRGIVATPKAQAGASAETRSFQNLLNIAQDPNSTELEKNSARRELGDLARAGTITGQERSATDKDLGDKVASQVGAEARSKEEGKSKAQLKFKPQIARAVKLAEKEAAERGEVLTDLSRMEASMPGLIAATDQLKELAGIATSTIGGKVFDFAVKETGFGSTKGANARAKFIAIISNQVLPLLKPTFGGAMTEGEGDKLAATLGDADASPTQKVEQINAFIENKRREVTRLSTQLKDTDNVDLSDPSITIEQLMAERKRLGG